MKQELIPRRIKKRFYWSGAIFISIMIIGTSGYYFFGHGNYSIIDCLYMTSMTISTVGYSEIIDLSNNPAGRIFTIIITFSGIGIFTFITSNMAAIIISGEIQESYKKKKMEKDIKKFKNHYIICGVGRVGRHIYEELQKTEKPVVAIDNNEATINELLDTFPNMNYIIGVADLEEVLEKAGINEAVGIFVATGEDSENLVICLTAR